VSSENYFRTVGQPLLRGREFLHSDTADHPRVVIINQSLASRLWPQADPVGQRVTFDNGTTWREIVGVVANTRQQIDSDPVDEIHLPLRQTGGLISGTIVVRTRGMPEAFTAPLRAALLRADPQQPITSIQTLENVRAASIASYRIIATLLGLFAILALVITSAGIGGVIAFTVSQRTQEIGIRMALGASRSSVLRMVLGQGLRLVGLGLAIGITVAFFLSRLIAGILFNVPPTDPATFATVAAVLIVVAIGACVIPARRATSINPVVALRAS
jgi:predicted permease